MAKLLRKIHYLSTLILLLVALVVCLISLFFQSQTSLALAQSTGASLLVDTGVSLACNGNGVCEVGENSVNCFIDCGCNDNGVCQTARDENSSNCADCPVTTGNPAVISLISPVIKNVIIRDITTNAAGIFWEVEGQALCQVALGKTIDYEQAVFSEVAFYHVHSASFNQLNPGSLYYFKISCWDTNYNKAESAGWNFTTLSVSDNQQPVSVSEFSAVGEDRKITLIWINPADPDFKEVKIFRSEDFYPTSPQEGTLVYVGDGDQTEDINLTNGQTYYYTAFAYDQAGNYSSGAVVSVKPRAQIIPPATTTLPAEPPIKPPVGPAPPEVEKISFSDFDFTQGGKAVMVSDGNTVIVNYGEPMRISIKYEKVPEVLKTIMVTLKKDNKYFSFLLRVSKEKTEYIANLLVPEPGLYPMTIYVLDYKNQALKKMDGYLEVRAGKNLFVSAQQSKWQVYYLFLKNNWFWLSLLLILFFLAILIGYWIYSISYQKKEKDFSWSAYRKSLVKQKKIIKH